MNNKNSTILLGWYGGDEVNACSAWTSTSRALTPEKRARIPKLLKDLASAGHETPFEKSIVHFLVDTEIASHVHLLKHRISSLNAESARYKELKEDKYYIPDDWNGLPNEHGFNTGIKRTDNIKFGDSDAFNWSDTLLQYTELGNKLYHACLKDLEPVLGRKRAKESARFFKTYNSQIQADVMFNWRSFVNFQKLRNSEHAQKEIREIAAEMLKLVKEIPENPFQHTLAAFNL